MNKMNTADKKEKTISIIVLAFFVIISLFLLQTEKRDNDGYLDDKIKKEQGGDNKERSEIIQEISEHIQHVAHWRRAFIAAFVVIYVITYVLMNRLPTLKEVIFMFPVSFFVIYFAMNWYQYHNTDFWASQIQNQASGIVNCV
jgi:hypothetical protein